MLDDNHIGVEGAEAIEQALQTNSTLEELSILETNISRELSGRIHSLVSKGNRDKRRLALENSQLGKEMLLPLAKKLKKVE